MNTRDPKALEQTRPGPDERARGLVSSRQSGERVAAGAFLPGEALADVVEKLWFGDWDLRGQPPHVTELISDPCVHLVFETGCAPRVVGVWTKLWTRELKERGTVRAAKLRPGAVRAFFDVPAHSLRNKMAPLAGHLPVDDALVRAVLGPDDHREGLVVLEAWLREHRRRRDEEGRRTAVLLAERCAAERTLFSAERLGASAGLSLRALQRLFREHVGVTPKWALRRARLQEAAVQAEQSEVALTELAYALGYADQAHMARDFKKATGKRLSDVRRAAREEAARARQGAA